MAKEESLKFDGQIVDVLPNATFRVQVDNTSNTVLATISGRMRQHNIKVMMGDKVEIEFSPYDMSRGRITRRN